MQMIELRRKRLPKKPENNPASLLPGGSPRIYAGEGALQRSEECLDFDPALQRWPPEIPGLKPTLKSNAFPMD
jgi:hypothetical protein